MDCRQESAATTFLRIEVLAIQGLVRAILFFFFGILMIPVTPIVLMAIRISRAIGEMPWWKIALSAPLWIAISVMLALVSPFKAFCRIVVDTKTIISVEWKERWRCGTILKPDGGPLDIPEEEEKWQQESNVVRGILEDYDVIE